MTSRDPQLRALLAETIGISTARAMALDASSPLFGGMPELDSMAAANLLGAIEDRFGIAVDDDDVADCILETYGHLLSFVEQRTAA